MKRVFGDTAFWVAYLNAKDRHHALAVQLMQQCTDGIVLSDWILVEIANFFSARPERALAGKLCEGLLDREAFVVVPTDRGLFKEGLTLYKERPDKKWSLTDCVSFAIMWRMGLAEALTSDHHFEQAGFRILMK